MVKLGTTGYFMHVPINQFKLLELDIWISISTKNIIMVADTI